MTTMTVVTKTFLVRRHPDSRHKPSSNSMSVTTPTALVMPPLSSGKAAAPPRSEQASEEMALLVPFEKEHRGLDIIIIENRDADYLIALRCQRGPAVLTGQMAAVTHGFLLVIPSPTRGTQTIFAKSRRVPTFRSNGHATGTLRCMSSRTSPLTGLRYRC